MALLALALLASRALWIWLRLDQAVYWEEDYRYVAALELATAPVHSFAEYQADHYQGGSLVLIALAAGLFRLFEPSLELAKLAAALVSTGIIALIYATCAKLFDRTTAAISALAYLAGPPLLAYWGVVPMGSHAESLAFSFGQILLWAGLVTGEWRRPGGWLAFGLMAGLGVWFCYTAGMTTIACGAAWLLLRGLPRPGELAAAAAGFTLGLAPWAAYNAANDFVGLGRLSEMFGGGDPIDRWLPLPAREKLARLVRNDLAVGWLAPLGSSAPAAARRLIRWAYLAPLAVGFAAAVVRALRAGAAAVLRAAGGAHAGVAHDPARERELPFVLFAAVFLAVYLISSFAIDPNGDPVKYRIFLTIAILPLPAAARSAALWIHAHGVRRGVALALAASALLASGIATLATATRATSPEPRDPLLSGSAIRGLLLHRKYEDEPELALACVRAIRTTREREAGFGGFGWGLEYRYEMDGDFGRIERGLAAAAPEERPLLVDGLRFWGGVRAAQLDDVIRRGRGRPLERNALARLRALLERTAPTAAAAPRPPDIVLVVIDNLRADHLGAYGYGRSTSPHFDALSRQGQLFTRAFAPSSWTKPSVASLFTSRAPSEHGAVAFQRHLRADLTTLAEALAGAGYATVGITGNFVHVTEATGLARGFAEFTALSFPVADPREDALFGRPVEEGGRGRARAPRAQELNERALPVLARSGDAPLFLYVHYMEPHAGFDPPSAALRAALGAGASAPLPARASADEVVSLARREHAADPATVRRLVDLYDGEIASVDAALGALWTALEARPGRKILAVASDHGEEFGEHGGYFHGLTLHGELLHVPLLLLDTGAGGGGGRRDEAVDLLDVAPTLLALAGVATPPSMRGRDLSQPHPPSVRPLVAELACDPLFEEHVRPREHRGALTQWPWKAIVGRSGRIDWYALDRDPRERDALGPGPAFPPTSVLDAAQSLARSTAQPGGRACRATVDLDDEERARLRALGYVE